MKPAWEVKTEDNQIYTVYESTALKCIRQMINDGFNEKDINSIRKVKKVINHEQECKCKYK
jgi:hypothetical protein